MKNRNIIVQLACIPFLFLFAVNLPAQDFHTIDFDSTSTFFKYETAYSKGVENTVLKVINDVEKLINPKFDNKIRIKVTTIDKEILALAYIVPKYENVLLFRNGITTGWVWQKYNTININPNDLSYDCELFINTNYEYNSVEGEFDNNKYDLYSIILHEYIHSLGFFSMITKNGESIETNYEQGIFSLFDTRLRADSNQLISFNAANLVTFNSELKPKLKDECAISYLLDLPIVFSPSDWQNGSSISHLDTNCLDKDFVMMPSIYKGQIKRIPLFEDLYVLSTLGYNITGLFRGDSILSEQQISDFSSYKIPISNNDFIDTISVIGNNVQRLPASLLISNDENIENIIPIQNEFIKFDKSSYIQNDTLILTLGRSQNPYQFNYYSKTVDGFISNPARVNIVISIENNSVGECKRDSRNLICNGDFEQSTTIGALKVRSEDAPHYKYNRSDTFEPCVPSTFLAGWDLNRTPDIYTSKGINEIPINYDFSYSIKYDFPNRILNLIKITIPDHLNNYFLGLFTGGFSKQEIGLGKDLDTMETISQELKGLIKNTKYKLDIDLISQFLGREDSLYIMFTKGTICENDTINFPPKDEYLLLSNRFNEKLADEVNLNQRFEWQHIVFNNLDISDFSYIYIFGNKTNNSNKIERQLGYYFLDNIILNTIYI